MAFSDIVSKAKAFAVDHPYVTGAGVAAGVVATGGIGAIVAGAGAGILAVSAFVAANLGTLATGAGIGGAAVVAAKLVKKDDDKK